MKPITSAQFVDQVSSKLPLLLLVHILSACSPSFSQNHTQIRRIAPHAPSDVGTLIEGVQEKEIRKLLDENPQVQTRIISKTHGIYEIFGLEPKKMKELWPKSKVEKNTFFNTFQANRQGLLASKAFSVSDQTSQESNGKSQTLEQCKDDSESPELILEVTESTQNFENPSIELGNEFSLSTQSSRAHIKHPSELRTGWLVITPEGSKKSQEVFFSPFLRYKPDAYGQYSIVVIVQDDRQVCAFSSFEFIVTGNKPYLGTREKFGSRLDILDKNLFSHRSEIRADQALEISQNKGKGVIIAVIDSGVNYNHPAQINNIWLNKKEVANNNIDDDNNGKIDDLIGYDFVNDDAFPFDDQGHGSHVSGLIASEYFGIAPHSLIMPLKALSPKGGDIGSIVGAIYYAVDQGAHILNLSLGSYGPPHPHLVEAINYAESKNVLVVAASGNGDPNSGAGLDTDKFPNFPSAFDNKNIISVAAKDSQHLLAPYSNYGMNSVDIAAPGGNPPDELLNSCFLENPSNILFTGMAGTSMAAPLVSGTLALMLSDSPKLSIDEVKNILLTSGRVAPGLEKLTVSGRYLDTLEALKKSQVY